MKKSSREKRLKYTAGQDSGLLGCWRIWEPGLTGSRMFQGCVGNIVPSMCLLVQSTTEEHSLLRQRQFCPNLSGNNSPLVFQTFFLDFD